jgi:hypothetical protein
MIYVRSWEAHCPALFSAATIEEAQSIASRLGYTDVWYDVNGEPNETTQLKLAISELKDKLEEVTDERDAAQEAHLDHDHSDCDDKIAELEQTVDETRSDLLKSRSAVKLLAGHVDLMQAIVRDAD